LQRRRKRLLELILGDQGHSPAALAELAEAAEWPLPERVQAVALEQRADVPLPVLPDDVLVDLEGGEPCLLFGGEDLDPAALARKLGGRRAAIGPPVPLAQARDSLRWARQALPLADGDRPVVVCADHLSTLLLFGDEPLLRELVARTLGPLNGLTTKQRQRMLDTLAAWVRTRGSAPEIASSLAVHPQTVRYRLRQLEELFGDRLHDPDALFDLGIALRALPLFS
jgi:hypothetical protein